MTGASTERVLVALLGLTFVTGIVDAISFIGLGHVFTANMTGNVVLLGFALAGATGLSITRSSLSLAAFLAGAVIGGRFALVMTYAPRRRWLVTAGIAETTMMIIAACVADRLDPGADVASARLYVVIALTAAAMGLRTATVRRLGVADMTTTVLTQTLAAVAADSSLAGGSNPRAGRRVAAVLLMLAGAAIGVLLVRGGLVLPLAVSAVCGFSAWAYAATAPPIAGERG